MNELSEDHVWNDFREESHNLRESQDNSTYQYTQIVSGELGLLSVDTVKPWLSEHSISQTIRLIHCMYA